MTYEAALERIGSGANDEVLALVGECVPKCEDELGRFTGDPVAVVGYADAEISNGGFHQFYENGIFNPVELIDHLLAIGAMNSAKAVRESMDRFPGREPPVRTLANLEPLDLSEYGVERSTFDPQDDLWYSSQGSLYAQLADYIRRHAERYAKFVADASES